MNNINFDLKLFSQHGDEVELLESPHGRTGPIPLVFPDNLADRLKLFRSGGSTRREINKLGEALFTGLFPNRIGEIWQQCKGNPNNRVIRIRLDIRDDKGQLQAIPWELIRDHDYFLALTERFPIVRFEKDLRYAVPSSFPSPLKVLLISATPANTSPLPGVNREIQILTEVLRRASRPTIQKVQVVENSTYKNFVAALSEGFDVVHFMGHGAFRENRGFLIFEDTNNQAYWCEAETIGDLVRDSKATLMVLNACETAITSASDETLLGVAKAVHKAGVPSVVAMQQVIRDNIASIFAQSFYEGLAKGQSIEKCMTSARLASKNAERNEGVEWAIPALFSNAVVETNHALNSAELQTPERTVNTLYAKGNYGPSILGDVTNITTVFTQETKPKK